MVGWQGKWSLTALRQYASTAHPKYPISKRTNKIQRQPTTKTIFQKSFCGAFSKKRPFAPAGASAFFFLRTFSFCAFNGKKKKWSVGLGVYISVSLQQF
jgi:hypothetical protein